jgi:hypothetical protein
MKVNDRSEEVEINHRSETEKYRSKPTMDLSNVKSMVYGKKKVYESQ